MYMSGCTHNRIQYSNFSKQLRNALTAADVDAEITMRPTSFYDLMMSTQFLDNCPTNRPTGTNY